MEGSGNNNPPTTSSAAAATLSPSSPTSSPSGPPVSRTGSPPWTQIVRGLDSEPAGASASPSTGEQNIPPEADNQPESSDNGNAGNNKKAAWNKRPSNGSVETRPVVMGAASWPALSESTKASPKSSSIDSSKNPSVPGSAPVSASQETGIASSSPPSSSLLSSQLLPPGQSSVTSQKPTTSGANHHPTMNHGRPARPKSFKRDAGGNAQANGTFSHQLSPGETSHNHNSSLKPSSGGGYESSTRDIMQNQGNREGDRNVGGDNFQPRSSFRRGNGGPHPRGDGLHQNYGGRRGDQDRGNHNWSHQRSFNGRDAPMQPRASPRGYVRTPPVSSPFVHPAGPAPMRPFMSPMGMPDMQMLYFHQGMQFVAPLHAPVYFPFSDPQLKARIVNQIDYYFSNENLVKDTYLRKNMDKNGWVPVKLIAGFNKVMQLTSNIQLILEAVQSSSVVETQGEKVRKRGDWMRWMMPSSVKFPVASGLQSPSSSNVSTLSVHIQSVTLDEKASDVNAEAVLRSSSGDLKCPSHVAEDGASSSGC